ncbi:MAG: hypothetical protein KGL53_05905 [Elusimicrobia bacterium]|nr:hypothetical protein [Elusimicrobiota bacterium]
MKRSLLTAVVSLLAAAAWAAAPAGEPVSLRGEVLDMSCYAAQGAHGKKHAACAKACLLHGAPAGLLTEDGAVYLLVDDHKRMKPYKMLRYLAGKEASVTGTLYRRGGIPIVAVHAVSEGASAAPMKTEEAAPMKDMGSQ